MPAPGAPVQELLIARLRSHARALFWSALVLIATCATVGFFVGNVTAPFESWMLFAGGAVIIIFAVIVPFIAWLTRSYAITTRRVIESGGFLTRRRRELSHARGYTVALRRGPLQRLWGAGTLTLSNGVDEPLRLTNVPNVRLVHEVLVDQVEVNQILAHRDARSATTGPLNGTGPTEPQF